MILVPLNVKEKRENEENAKLKKEKKRICIPQQLSPRRDQPPAHHTAAATVAVDSKKDSRSSRLVTQLNVFAFTLCEIY